jgi:hypothetical protein
LNAVEIEEAVSELFEQPFDAVTFPGAFLESFGNKPTVIKRLQSAASLSDIDGAVLQRNNIHLKVCPEGQVNSVFNQLKNSPATAKNKTKFILATDGVTVEAEDLSGDAPLVCDYKDFQNHFGYFLPLAGIETVKQIRDSSFDIRATSRLNRLYIELLKDNPEWGTADNRHEMNHFMARLIFCFFAEDTDIIRGERLFTTTIEQMSERDSSNTNQIIGEIFRALNTKKADRASEKLPRWTEQFPYVNGGLFAGKVDVPRFSKIARSYLLHIGSLDWTKINPDIFGSMIQAVADDEERGSLGMHYTSVPNILKVLNPLFLDDLRGQLEAAGDNARTLLNLRKRIAKIRVFDPACGSGNFLVISYKEMREIENEINVRRGEVGRKSDIPLTNFRGIELKDFPAEIARLALIIAEYQCDLLYRGQKEALDDFLPLDSQNWITCGNALKIDWLSLCPPTGTSVRLQAHDLFETPLDQAQIEFENEGGETYICGNPPFTGTRKQSEEQKKDLKEIFSKHTARWKNVDYVGAWLIKAAEYNKNCSAPFAFVTTNSLCQGQQVPITWTILKNLGFKIRFAYSSFIWSNLAQNRAGVTVIVVGLDSNPGGERFIITDEIKHAVENINPYLTHHKIDAVLAERRPLFIKASMDYGVYYSKSAGLILGLEDVKRLREQGLPAKFIRRFLGSSEFINGNERYCLWIDDASLDYVSTFPEIHRRIEEVRKDRTETEDKSVNKLAAKSHQFRERKGEEDRKILIPIVSSENREYLPVGLADGTVIPTNRNFYIGDAKLWCLSIISSKLHLAWIAAICGRMRSDYMYSNTLGWNTFPIPVLTEKNIHDLNQSAIDILLARETHFPDSLADLYEVKEGISRMPNDLREAHDRNDEVLERIYIGRRFKNDTERLEKLFELYTKMTSKK